MIEFYQADGLQWRFEIVFPGVTTMEVDNETVDDEDPRDVVLNPKDIQMLERFHLGKDNEEDTEPSDSVAHLGNFDSDDETYDPRKIIPKPCNTMFFIKFCYVYSF
jgi:hypothetical protein